MKIKSLFLMLFQVIITCSAFFLLFILIQYTCFELLNLQSYVSIYAQFLAVFFLVFAWPGKYGKITFLGLNLFLILFNLFFLSVNHLENHILLYDLAYLLGYLCAISVKQKTSYQIKSTYFMITAYLFIRTFQSAHTIEYSRINNLPKNHLYSRLENTCFNSEKYNLRLNKDTVYLINFTSFDCMPCKAKQSSLNKLQKRYHNRAFKIIEVYCFTKFEKFKNNLSTAPNNYFLSDIEILKKFYVAGFPTEILINKNGHVVRKIDGFSSSLENDYLLKSINTLDTLI